ncbi:MAG: V-type ATPase subunit [Spirochaetota bacterium]
MNRSIDYTYFNARLHGMISRLLTDRQIEAMDRAATIPELLYLLRETPYGHLAEVYTETGDTNMVELELILHHRSMFANVRKHSPDKLQPVIRAFAFEIDSKLLLSSIRLWFDQCIRGRSIGDFIGYIPEGTSWQGVTPQQIINAQDLSELLVLLERAAFVSSDRKNELIPHLKEELQEVPESKHLYYVELAIDSAYYLQLRKAERHLPKEDQTILSGMTDKQTDNKNVGRMIRHPEQIHTLLQEQNSMGMIAEQLERILIPKGKKTSIEQVARALSSRQQRRPEREEGSRRREPSSSEARRAVLQLLVDIEALTQQQVQQSGEAAEASRQKATLRELTAMERNLAAEQEEQARRLMRADPFTIATLIAFLIFKKRDIETVRSLMHATYYGLQRKEVYQA